MKQAVAKKWVKALRSGKYKQANGQLYTGKGYCCLGVLCKVLGEEFVPEGIWQDWVVKNTKEGVVLPAKVKKAAGMRTKAGEFMRDEIGITTSLANLNDEGKRFKTIANVIEQYWKVL